MDFVERFGGSEAVRNAVSSVALLVAVLVGRTFAARVVRRSPLPSESRLRWMARIRSAALVTFFLALTIIWAEELRAVAVSIVAVAVAFVLATKELILSVSGSLVRSSSRAFSLGDRIEV